MGGIQPEAQEEAGSGRRPLPWSLWGEHGPLPRTLVSCLRNCEGVRFCRFPPPISRSRVMQPQETCSP